MTRSKKFPTMAQWSHLFKIFSKKEKIWFSIFFVLAILSFSFLVKSFYFKNTKPVPAVGGIFREGIVGQPRFINPIYANSDADRALSQLIFSGLMKYDENMNLIPDLAEKYEISPDGKTYTFYLKDNLFWQDGQPLTSDDIIFTIQSVQDPDAKSPLQANWIGVKAEKIDDKILKLTLQKPYSGFLDNSTLKIIPKHVWENIPTKNFPLENDLNLNPIGSGPYKIKEIQKDSSGSIKSVNLDRNEFYYGKKPYISSIKILFFKNEQELKISGNQGIIDGLSLSSFQNIIGKKSYSLSFPRYFAVFLNQKEKILKDENVRLALNYATNKKEIIREVLGIEDEELIEQQICDSPILPKVYGFNAPEKKYDFNLEKAKEILEKDGFKENENKVRQKEISQTPSFTLTKYIKSGSRGEEVRKLQECLIKLTESDPSIYPNGEATGYFGAKTKSAVIRFQEKYAEEVLTPWGYKKGTGIVGPSTRKKLNELCFPEKHETVLLSFSLVTVNEPQLSKTAEIIKNQWAKAGINLEVKKVPLSELETEFIKPRNYQLLLLGEALSSIPDPLPFWHSSQKIDPGLNISLYSNKNADQIMEKIRTTLDPKKRKESLEELQNIIIADSPAIFLYSPQYIYYLPSKIKGFNVKKITKPSERFIGIENWYIKTKRVWK